MRLKPLLFIAIAIGLYVVSSDVGLQGDAAPLVPGGVSPERAKYHLIALVLITFGAFNIVALVRNR